MHARDYWRIDSKEERASEQEMGVGSRRYYWFPARKLGHHGRSWEWQWRAADRLQPQAAQRS